MTINFKRIRLELARDHDFPEGSSRHGYEIVAPLDEGGKLDASEWKHHREKCRVRRFWGSDEPELGHLIRKPGGQWALHYDIHGDPDQTGYRFGEESFVLGEYVSIRDEDDDVRAFRVVRIDDIHWPSA
jgi:hypothetical protein